MITLQPITPVHPHYAFVAQLLESAFPEEERRDLLLQQHLLEMDCTFHCLLIEQGHRPIGFFTYWDFNSFIYLEHFAIAPEERNQGQGSIAFQQFKKQTQEPIVLEAEPPTDALKQRRINFYLRQGMQLWKQTTYVQPPYRLGGTPVPLLLMGSEGLNEEVNRSEVVKHLHEAIQKR
jgi:hypothetical protein